jgi:hypothetical protein
MQVPTCQRRLQPGIQHRGRTLTDPFAARERSSDQLRVQLVLPIELAADLVACAMREKESDHLKVGIELRDGLQNVRERGQRSKDRERQRCNWPYIVEHLGFLLRPTCTAFALAVGRRIDEAVLRRLLDHFAVNDLLSLSEGTRKGKSARKMEVSDHSCRTRDHVRSRHARPEDSTRRAPVDHPRSASEVPTRSPGSRRRLPRPRLRFLHPRRPIRPRSPRELPWPR